MSKESRRAETAFMLKCDCGNVSRQNSLQCGACEAIDEHNSAVAYDLSECTTVEDLKDFIQTHVSIIGRD